MEAQKIAVKGKNKNLIAMESPHHCILKFTDGVTRFDNEMRSGFPGKAQYRVDISEMIFKYLHSYNIPTHYIDRKGETELEVQYLDMLPVVVTVRNYAAGSFSKKFNLKKGNLLKYPVLEYQLKLKGGEKVLITESQAYALEYATPEEMKHLARLCLKINAVLKSFMERRNLKLADYQLEFGRNGKYIVLGDEISPDTCRIWNVEKDGINFSHFNYSDGNAKSAYCELYDRLALQRRS